MNKLIFRKLSYDIFTFFLLSSLAITSIVWVIQGVNLLDIITEKGHAISVYFFYTLLNVPKIFSKLLIFTYFLTLFVILSRYEENNEILVFWTNGIKKINFINFIFKISLFFVILQLILSILIVPYTQSLSRTFLKNSNVDFLPTLISEKKFINIFKNLTIFLEKYNKNGNIEKIFIKEKISEKSSKIIIAENAQIIKLDEEYKIKLLNGAITNINDKNVYNINFKETEYDLSKFTTKTVTHPKIQEINSLQLINCFYNYELNKKYKRNNICKNRKLKSISEEMFKRFIVPLYIFILSLISSSIILKPKKSFFLKYYKSIIFIFGFIVTMMSQISFKFIAQSNNLDLIVISTPILLIIIYYFFLILKTKSQFKTS